jgi:hypothetical protein
MELYIKYLIALPLAGVAVAQTPPQSPDPACHLAPVRRMLDLPEARLVACMNAWLDRGMPASGSPQMTFLTHARSSLVLPIIEKKIEDVVVSRSPRDCFTDQRVDPVLFTVYGAETIAQAANEQAFRELSKLMRLDEHRFGEYVESVLLSAQAKGDPYPLAYRGFDIGDPAVDKRIAAWAEKDLAEEMERFSSPAYENVRRKRRIWAETLMERYGGVPTETQWKTDPLVSRLKPDLAAAIHDSVMRYTREALQRQKPK